MRISEAYPSKYFKAADLGGKERTVKISGCFNEELGQGSDKKTRPVLYFEGHKKGLVINKTNSIAISEIYGDETEAWIGRDIVIFSRPVEFQGRTVQGLRVRVPQVAPGPVPTVQHAPAAPAPEPDTAPLNDEIPW